MFNIFSYIIGRNSIQTQHTSQLAEDNLKFISILKVIEKTHGEGMSEGYLDAINKARSELENQIGESEFHRLIILDELNEDQENALGRYLGSKYLRKERIINLMRNNIRLTVDDVENIRDGIVEMRERGNNDDTEFQRLSEILENVSIELRNMYFIHDGLERSLLQLHDDDIHKQEQIIQRQNRLNDIIGTTVQLTNEVATLERQKIDLEIEVNEKREYVIKKINEIGERLIELARLRVLHGESTTGHAQNIQQLMDNRKAFENLIIELEYEIRTTDEQAGRLRENIRVNETLRNATGEEIPQLEAEVAEMRQQTEEKRAEYGAYETEYNALETLYRNGEEVLQSQLHVVGQREYTFRQLEAAHNEKIENIATLRATTAQTTTEYEAFILEKNANRAEAIRMRTELHNNNNELERLITQLGNH